MAITGNHMNEMPVGISDFKELRDSRFYYVDKTKLLNDILTPARGTKLFTRPRRFGKTLSISMIDAYLNLRYADGPDRFEGLKISEMRPNDPEKNSNVVVMITLKDLGDGTYDHFLDRMEKTAFDLYQSFLELQGSEMLDPGSLEIYNKIYGRRSTPRDLESCLADLCKMLKKHVRNEAPRRFVKSKSEVARGFVPSRPYRDMRSEQSVGMKLPRRSGDYRVPTMETARVSGEGRTYVNHRKARNQQHAKMELTRKGERMNQKVREGAMDIC